MALEFIDSMSHSGVGGSALDPNFKYTSASGAVYISTPVRRSGQTALGVGSINKTLSYQTTRTVGLAYYMPNTGSSARFLTFSSGTSVLVYIVIESDGTLSIYTGPSFIRIYNSGSSHLIVTYNVYHYFETTVTLSGSTPIAVTVDVTVDGQVWASGVTGNTGFNASDLFINAAQMNVFTINGTSGGSFIGNVCDLYCLNPNTTDINGNPTTLVGMLGDVEIDALVAVTDVTTQWSNQGGSPPPVYPMINQIPPPTGDTEYIFSNTTGQKDTFNFQPLTGLTGTILGAQLLIFARKDAEGTRTIQGIVGSTPQVSLYGAQNYLYDYYDYHIWPLDSDNGTPWTPTIYNAEDFGVNLSA